jgi:integrase
MASFRKNKAGKWEAQIARKGVRRSGTFETKREAERWAAQVETEILGGKKGAIDKTFGDLLTKYREEVVPGKGGPDIEDRRISRLLKDDIAKLKLRDFNASHIAAWRDNRSKEVAPATVMRDMSTMSAAITRAVKEWKWLDHNPFKDVEWPKPPPGRDRRITENEIERILLCAGYQYDEKPESVRARTAAAFLFAIETAMRDGEIASLAMENVFVDKKYAHLRTRDADGYNKRNVPLSPEALRIIKQMDVKEGSLFGLTAQQISATFQRIKNACLINNLTFHDSRHEAITRLATVKKINVLDLAKITGHKKLDQLMTYYNKSATDIAEGL